MDTKYFNVDKYNPDNEIIKYCSEVIKSGGLVAFPTETVYGLGANALDENAVRKIFEAKGRPEDNPLILHIHDIDMASPYVSEIPEIAHTLSKAFWPGPLSMIMKKSEKVPDAVTAGLNTVAVRVPDHPVALSLIKACNLPIAAPSANISGKPSPTDGSHVKEDMSGKINAIIDSGKCDIGLESTVIDLTGDRIRILRPGGISSHELKLLVPDIEANDSGNEEEKPKSPGMKYKHYSPDSPITIVKGSYLKAAEIINLLCKDYSSPGILCSLETMHLYDKGEKLCVGSRNNPKEIASNLFDCFRIFNRLNVEIIFSEYFDIQQYGEALMNRLLKAAGYKLIEV